MNSSIIPIELKTPLSKDDVINLRVGDIVCVTGYIFTARSQFHIRVVDHKTLPPFDSMQTNVMFHSGPIVEKRQNGWKVRAISITTSVRFNNWEPEIIKTMGLRALIGKGKVGIETREALKRYGCVHLARTTLFSGAYAEVIESVADVHWLDLGDAEATWILKVNKFGPFVIGADSQGNSLYDQVSKDIETRVNKAYNLLGIENYQFADYKEKSE